MISMTDVVCPSPDCGAVIGQAINIEGLIMLRAGVYLIRDSQGTCMQCGRTFYWSVSNRAINKVIKLSLTLE